MGAEHDIHLGDDALKAHVVVEFFVGVNDVELCHVAAADAIEAGFIGNLLQGRGERPGVATEFSAAGIGHIFTRARNGEARKPAKDITDRAPDDDQHQGKDDNDSSATATFTARAASRSAEHRREQLYRNRLKGRKNSHEHNADDHESRVTILDVREFVAHNGGKFRVIQLFNEAGRERDSKRGHVNAARKCIQAGVLYNVDLRHFDAACDAEVLDNIIDAHVIFAL